MNTQITVRNMLEMMESGLPFSLTYVTYDSQRKKGGRLITYHEAELLQADEPTPGRQLTKLEETQKRTEDLRTGRDPRHQKWYTRNIRILQNGHRTGVIQKIHPPLVVLFNEKTVVA